MGFEYVKHVGCLRIIETHQTANLSHVECEKLATNAHLLKELLLQKEIQELTNFISVRGGINIIIIVIINIIFIKEFIILKQNIYILVQLFYC